MFFVVVVVVVVRSLLDNIWLESQETLDNSVALVYLSIVFQRDRKTNVGGRSCSPFQSNSSDVCTLVLVVVFCFFLFFYVPFFCRNSETKKSLGAIGLK